VSIAERALIAAAAFVVLVWVAWGLAQQTILGNLRLQAELARCQQAAVNPAPAPAPLAPPRPGGR
jgi:hypothetical protein